MKATIEISGQINGNSTLKGAIDCYDVEKTMFYGYRLNFNTKKEAKKALWGAYKFLRSDSEKRHCLRYSGGTALYYDASKAIIS
jgi:hypothetical protein